MWAEEGGAHGDPVELLDADGRPVLEVRQALEEAWWARRQRSRARARPWLERLYPQEVPVDWAVSTGVFRRPMVNAGKGPGGMFGVQCTVGQARVGARITRVPMLWG